ncbi:MAG: hypothetical protein GX654_04285 [Desulfatiglans sp.]|jgi:hypothetical protein|nr:hypothetical protein [Desulfatiglans sp.]
MKLKKIFTLMCILALCGCSTLSNFGRARFSIAVDSLAASGADSKKTYLLLPGNQGVTEADLQFKEYAEYLKRVLNKKGYVYTESKDDADVAIYLAYGMGDPETHLYSYDMPVWGRTGYYASRTRVAETTTDGKTSYRTYTTYTPSYGFIGYNSYIDSVTTYMRFAVITAYDYSQFKKDETEVQLWKTTVSSTGTTDDLRRIFPMLMAASIPYLATDTGRKVYMTMYETDPVVQEIKRGTPFKKPISGEQK